MAGFAIFMTIVIYGFFSAVVATIMSVTLVLVARRRVPQDSPGRRNLLRTCGFAPFAGLLWLIVAFLIHVQISNRLAHQDCGSLSGDPYVTLPNGYVLGSLNTYDGYIVAPGYKTDVPFTGPGYVRGLIDLKWDGTTFSGTYFDSNLPPTYVRGFTFDTRDLSIRTFDPPPITWQPGDPSPEDHPYSYWRLYQRYRHHWPNFVLLALILAGEGTIAVGLYRPWRIVTKTVTPTEPKSTKLLNL
jgi:hypothetical protein